MSHARTGRLEDGVLRWYHLVEFDVEFNHTVERSRRHSGAPLLLSGHSEEAEGAAIVAGERRINSYSEKPGETVLEHSLAWLFGIRIDAAFTSNNGSALSFFTVPTQQQWCT